ncbi:MAG: hypothetical protein ONB12_03290 [candidate division KSB1 bacterium]|nr:hypothetical protein [candidate division KSB1 bacterium]
MKSRHELVHTILIILLTTAINGAKTQTPVYRFVEVNGIVAMEAENADRIIGWKLIDGKSKQALQDTSAQGKGYMTYSVRIDQPGKYWVSLLCLAPFGDTSKNDCYVYLDGKRLYGIDDKTRPDGMRCHTATFQWSALPKGPGGHTPEVIKEHPVYALVEKAGVHEFKIVSRSKEFCVDKIVLKLDDKTPPTGLGPEETTAASVGMVEDQPVRFALLRNYPNPFNVQTTISVAFRPHTVERLRCLWATINHAH